jgi:hypothetical protein
MSLKKQIKKDIPETNLSFDEANKSVDYEAYRKEPERRKGLSPARICLTVAIPICCGLIVGGTVWGIILSRQYTSGQQPGEEFLPGAYAIKTSFEDSVFSFPAGTSLTISTDEIQPSFKLVGNQALYFAFSSESNLNSFTLKNYTFVSKAFYMTFAKEEQEYSCYMHASDYADNSSAVYLLFSTANDSDYFQLTFTK